MLSVAVTVQVMGVPIGCGDWTDGVTDRIWTVAWAGRLRTPSNEMTKHKLRSGNFMGADNVTRSEYTSKLFSMSPEY